MITQNAKLLYCSYDMQNFMDSNNIQSIPRLFDIKIDQLVQKPDFPYRLLEEWLMLRDRLSFLSEN